MTIYHMRILERLWGSLKFTVRPETSLSAILALFIHNPFMIQTNPRSQSFVLSLFPTATLIPPLLLALVIRPLSLNALNYLPAGPTPLIFALLAQYHAAIPHVYKYRIVTSSFPSSSGQSQAAPEGPVFSDKSVVYLLAGQLAFSQVPGSLISAGLGWGIGVAWRNEILPLQLSGWRAPGWIVGEKREGEGFEGLRRRLEGEERGLGRGSAVEPQEGAGPRQRRGMGRAILDQFRGAF